MKKRFFSETRTARNEQFKSGALIMRTVGFGALGVGLWDPLSGGSDGNALLIGALIVTSLVFFYTAHRLLG